MRRSAILCLVIAALGMTGARALPTTAPHQPLNDMFHAYGDAGAGWSFGEPRTWTGGDSTYSVPLPDGRVVWIFSDTFLSPTNACGPDEPQPCHRRQAFGTPLVNNTFVVQKGTALTRTLHGGTDAAPRALIVPPFPNGSRSFYWMGDGTVEGGELRVFVRRYPIIGTLPPSAEATDIATFSLPGLTLVRIDEGVSTTGIKPWAFLSPHRSSPVPVTWGAGILEDGGYTYIYGTEEYPLAKHLHVARVATGHLLDGTWEFFDGTGWSTDPLSTKRILANVAGELSIAKTDDGYRLIASELGIGDILMHTAPKPEGPWGARTVLYRPPEAARGAFTYNAHEHPHLNTPGKVVLSYNVNGQIDGQDIYEDVHVYRPRFLEITL